MLNIESERLHIEKYPIDFGHKFENNLARALKDNLSDVVEEVELATPREDQIEGVDLWVKFRNIDDPVALQVTFTSSDERMTEKERDIEKRSLARKDDRPDSLIKANRSCHRVLAAYQMARVKKGDIDQSMQADTLRQILAGLPNHSRVLYIKAIQDAMKRKKIAMSEKRPNQFRGNKL